MAPVTVSPIEIPCEAATKGLPPVPLPVMVTPSTATTCKAESALTPCAAVAKSPVLAWAAVPRVTPSS